MRTEEWSNILAPEKLKSNLEFAALYIALYEKLEDTIITRVRDFFTLLESDDSEYIKHVLDLYDAKKCPRINKDCRSLISSLIWLVDSKAITDEDIQLLSKLKSMKNQFTHDMFLIIVQGLPEGVEALFAQMIDLFNRIERWWIIEFEIPISGNIDDIDFDNIMSGNMLILHAILNITANNSNKDFAEVCELLNIPIK